MPSDSKVKPGSRYTKKWTSAQVETAKNELKERGLWDLFDHLRSENFLLWSEIFGNDRHQRACRVRHQLIAKLREMGWSFHEIGDLFGRDANTVQKAVKNTQDAGDP